MRELTQRCIEKVSGAADLVFKVEQRFTHYHEISEPCSVTFQFDGSMPPELQARIDAGESFESMSSVLLLYNLIINQWKIIYPELFI